MYADVCVNLIGECETMARLVCKASELVSDDFRLSRYIKEACSIQYDQSSLGLLS